MGAGVGKVGRGKEMGAAKWVQEGRCRRGQPSTAQPCRSRQCRLCSQAVAA